MLTGHIDRVDRHGVIGWAGDTNNPDGVVEITISVSGQSWATIRCDLHRGDLESAGCYGRGLHGFEYRFPVQLLDDTEYRVSVYFRETGRLVPNGQAVLPAQRHPDRIPLLVTGPARSGTTLLMHRLARSRHICVASVMPFEVRLLTYYWTAFRTLTAGADFANSTHPDRLTNNEYFVGSNPFSEPYYRQAFADQDLCNEFFFARVPDTLGVAFRKIISSYYDKLAMDQNKHAVRLFAEKKLSLAPDLKIFIQSLFGRVKEIVLIRDPRDVYASRLSYFAGLDPENAFVEVTEDCANLLQMKLHAGEDTAFVSYETLVNDPGKICEDLGYFLNADIPAEPSDEQSTMFKEHGTSESPNASIGRWKRDFTEAQKRRCNDTWADFLTTFALP